MGTRAALQSAGAASETRSQESGECVVREVTERETVDGRRYYPGDFVLAMQGYGRDPADSQGRTFRASETGYVSSSDVRLAGFELTDITLRCEDGSLQVTSEQFDSDSDDDTPLHAVMLRLCTYELCSKVEQKILDKCW